MAQRGGKRDGAGRPSGAKNKVTAERRATISEMAREFADDALRTLAKIAQNGESEAARVSAANAILDRAFGKPVQGMELTGKNGGPIRADVTSAAVLAALARKHDAD